MYIKIKEKWDDENKSSSVLRVTVESKERPPTAWKPNHAVESRSMRSFSNEKPGPEGKLFLRGVFIQ